MNVLLKLLATLVFVFAWPVAIAVYVLLDVLMAFFGAVEDGFSDVLSSIIDLWRRRE